MQHIEVYFKADVKSVSLMEWIYPTKKSISRKFLTRTEGDYFAVTELGVDNLFDGRGFIVEKFGDRRVVLHGQEVVGTYTIGETNGLELEVTVQIPEISGIFKYTLETRLQAA